jgi:hypothetical protein
MTYSHIWELIFIRKSAERPQPGQLNKYWASTSLKTTYMQNQVYTHDAAQPPHQQLLQQNVASTNTDSNCYYSRQKVSILFFFSGCSCSEVYSHIIYSSAQLCVHTSLNIKGCAVRAWGGLHLLVDECFISPLCDEFSLSLSCICRNRGMPLGKTGVMIWVCTGI